MGFKIMKCPACGGDLNIETDRDFLFCQFCGAKLMRDDRKIVIEHVERKIDEAKIRQIEFEEKKLATEKFSKKRRWILVNVIGLALLIVGYIFSKIDHVSFLTIMLNMSAYAVLFIGNLFLFIMWHEEHLKKK